MSALQSLPWVDPLIIASGLKEDEWVLLYSSARTSYSGRYSYLAHGHASHIVSSDFTRLAGVLSDHLPWHENAWFGYLGYGLKDALEPLDPEPPGFIDMPALSMTRFHNIWRFDHEKHLIDYIGNASPQIPIKPSASHYTPPTVSMLASNMTKAEYIEKVGHIKKRIQMGELYQANLTRKFYGEFISEPDAFALFRTLSAVSPAPYSAYISTKNTHILSSSPEQFLKISPEGHVQTRPIKGTAPRFEDMAQDHNSRSLLERSEKDRAENLMIVDLMRNDLSRSCEAGSIKVERLFDVTSHAGVHHMSSAISGKKRADRTTLDAVAACFPAGSMTGAPKFSAINLCTGLEAKQRGVYAGGIGYFGGDGSCELSVVIRTLILQGRRFEFQVGGGIVADSEPEDEFQETMHKARGLLATLNVPQTALESL